jgi:hypothetical protein
VQHRFEALARLRARLLHRQQRQLLPNHHFLAAIRALGDMMLDQVVLLGF